MNHVKEEMEIDERLQSKILGTREASIRDVIFPANMKDLPEF